MAIDFDRFKHWCEDRFPDCIVKGKEVRINSIFTTDTNYHLWCSPSGGKKKRHATYFLAKAEFTDLVLKKEGGLDDAQWFPLASVGDLNFYDDILPIITRAINILAQKQS